MITYNTRISRISLSMNLCDHIYNLENFLNSIEVYFLSFLRKLSVKYEYSFVTHIHICMYETVNRLGFPVLMIEISQIILFTFLLIHFFNSNYIFKTFLCFDNNNRVQYSISPCAEYNLLS